MTANPSAPAPSTGGRLVYAVGDVHGYAAHLDDLLAAIAEDAAAAAPAERPVVVLIGDYVDRGPDSRRVIDRIIALQADTRFEVVALKGNHEDALERFLSDPAFAPAWIANWGQATLRSYGVAPPVAFDPIACEAVQARFAAVLPAEHRAFLEGLRLSFEVGDYLFVHAGVRPGVPLGAQAERDLIWIRYDFLESDEPFGRVVVHGHTPAERPEVRHNRINIDTGVYFSGVLTALRVSGEEQGFLHAYR